MQLSSNRAIARIYLNNILHNINEFKKIRKENTKICAIVKADAYGHGSIEVAKYIEKNVDYFAVSTGDEATELRNSGIIKPMLVLGYVFEEEIENLIKNDVYFTVYNIHIAEKISKKAKEIDKRAKIHIKLDTGMSRIGFLEDDDYINDIKYISNMDNIDILGCFSHFALADETKNEFNEKQYQKFNKMCINLEKEGIKLGIKHISNSSASETSKYDLDMVRLGIGIYGYSLNDVKNLNLNLIPAMRLESLVSNIKYLKKGSTVSYCRNYTLKEDEYIATIPIGYADGISRAVSNKDFKIVFEKGIQGTVVGNICMDQMMVKVDEKIPMGTKAYIFGYDKNSGHYISDLSSTIIDETICAIHKRVKHEYETSGDIYDI